MNHTGLSVLSPPSPHLPPGSISLLDYPSCTVHELPELSAESLVSGISINFHFPGCLRQAILVLRAFGCSVEAQRHVCTWMSLVDGALLCRVEVLHFNKSLVKKWWERGGCVCMGWWCRRQILHALCRTRLLLKAVTNGCPLSCLSIYLQETGDNQQFCWRNMFSCINLLRSLNKLTKWKHSRTMVSGLVVWFRAQAPASLLEGSLV